jgi:hypothetical protein
MCYGILGLLDSTRSGVESTEGHVNMGDPQLAATEGSGLDALRILSSALAG